MGKKLRAKKFAAVKRTLNPKDKRIKLNQDKYKKKEKIKNTQNNVTKDLDIRELYIFYYF